MNTSYKAKAKLSSLLFFALLLGAFASAFSANISPLTFGNDATDNAKWQRLVKYKLWATGSVGQDAISFETNAKIEDSRVILVLLRVISDYITINIELVVLFFLMVVSRIRLVTIIF